MAADSPPIVSRHDNFEEEKGRYFKIRMLTIGLFAVQIPDNIKVNRKGVFCVKG
jgi:hypothetical protein